MWPFTNKLKPIDCGDTGPVATPRSWIERAAAGFSGPRGVVGVLSLCAVPAYSLMMFLNPALGGMTGERSEGRYWLDNHGAHNEVAAWQWWLMRTSEIGVFVGLGISLIFGSVVWHASGSASKWYTTAPVYRKTLLAVCTIWVIPPLTFGGWAVISTFVGFLRHGL